MSVFARETRGNQRGAATVEFALVAMIFFTLLFGIVEFGRGFYIYNSIQEVTRYVARESVTCWRDQWDTMKNSRGLIGMSALPGAPELTTADITIEPLRRFDMQVLSGSDLPVSVDENASNCMKPDSLSAPQNCIGFVRVRIAASFKPLLAPFLPLPSEIPFPPTTVIMPSESLGLLRDGCNL